MKQHYRPISLLLLIAGLLVLCFGIYLPFQPKSDVAIANIAIMEEGILTTGEVVAIRKTMQKTPNQKDNPDAMSKLHEIAEVKYSVDGKSYNATGSRLIQNPSWEKGDLINISYSVDNPQKYAIAEQGIEGFDSQPYLPGLCIISGILLGIGGMIFHLRKNS